MKRFIRCLAGLVCVAVASRVATPLGAQTLGEITGVVSDSSGAVIVGAKVTATNTATNASRTAVSNDAGVYSVPAMQPGSYTLKVEMAGFFQKRMTSVRFVFKLYWFKAFNMTGEGCRLRISHWRFWMQSRERKHTSRL